MLKDKMSNPNMVKEVDIKKRVAECYRINQKEEQQHPGLDYSMKAAAEIDALYQAERKAEIEKALLFVKHIENHLTELGLKDVICKICGKTIDEIYDAEIRKSLGGK